MSFRATSFHEAGHTVVWMLEEKYLGPVNLVSALPFENTTGRVRGTNDAVGPVTPRKLRALGYLNAAGLIAERLAGFNPPAQAAGKDIGNLAVLSCHPKCGPHFIDECRAGAERLLRGSWTAVERVAEHLRTIGELTPPHGIALVRMALEEPQRPLHTDMETFVRLLSAVEDVPEFREEIESAARTLSAQVA